MPSRLEDDWSDSDDDDLGSEIETSVLLGIPDGAMEEEGDGVDAAVSRIGGLPVRFLSPFPHHFYHTMYRLFMSNSNSVIRVFILLLFRCIVLDIP